MGVCMPAAAIMRASSVTSFFQSTNGSAAALSTAAAAATGVAFSPASKSRSPFRQPSHSPHQARHNTRGAGSAAGMRVTAGGASTQYGLSMSKLCDLGVSPAAARLALSRCRGDLEHACTWLFDEDHDEEIWAEQIASTFEGPTGCPKTVGPEAFLASSKHHGAV